MSILPIKLTCNHQFKLRGTENVAVVFGLQVIAYNLMRLGKLLRPSAMEVA